MALQKVTEAEYLIQEIDEMIQELKLRKGRILARMPQQKPTKLMTHLKSPSGRILKIKGRKDR